MGAFFQKLKTRAIALVLLAVVPALLLILYSASQRRVEDAKLVQENALRLSQFVAANLSRDIEAARDLLMAMAQHTSQDQQSTCPAVVLTLPKSSNLYRNIGFASPDGSVTCSYLPPASGSVADRPWFQRAMETRAFSVGDYASSVEGEVPVLYIGLPVLQADGSVRSVLFAALDVSWLNELAADTNLPPGATLSVSDRNGTIVARYPDAETWVGKNVPDTPILKIISSQKEGTAEAVGIDGVDRLYAFSDISDFQLFVHAGITREAAFAAGDKSLQRNLAGMGVVAILAIIAAWFGSEYFFVRQIRQLIATTRELALGDLSARTTVSYSAGELGVLAKAFDEMAESLEFRNAQLRESETERMATETRFTGLVDSAATPIISLEESGRINLFNKGAEEALGYSAQQVHGSRFEEFLHPDSVVTFQKCVADLAEGRRSSVCRAQLRHGSGSSVHFEVAVSRLEQEGVTQYTLVLRNAGPVDDAGGSV